MQEVESPAVVQVDPGLEVEGAIALPHFPQRGAARCTNRFPQRCETGLLE